MPKGGIHCLLTLCAVCFLSTLSLGQGFEAEISAFEQADLLTPPPEDPILFVGSSSIRVWPDLPGDFPDDPVMNRGFGGSKMSDVLYYFDRVVAPYDPVFILVYEGDNDLAAGMSVDSVYDDDLEFLALVEAQLPDADVAFIATKPSPSRSQYLEVTRQLNARLEELASTDSSLWYIDIFTPMLDDTGQPRPELFGSDMLHMNAAGYELWTSIIGPVLDEWAMPKMQTLLFDFGSSDTPTDNDPANTWNNVTQSVGCSDSGQLALVTVENIPTKMDLVMLSRFNGANTNGTQASTLFPLNATRDSLFGNTETFSGLSNVFPSFVLTGLDPLLVYDFTFYASRMNVRDGRETGYTVTGANAGFTALNPSGNEHEFTIVTGIEPDGAGQIAIDLAPTPNNVNANHFTYLGVMKVEPRPANW